METALNALKRVSPLEVRRVVYKKGTNFCNLVLKKYPPVVQENKILFYASEDFADNPRALYEYFIEQGLNEKYELVWLVEHPRKLRRTMKQDNVRFVRVKDAQAKMLTHKARREAVTSKYLFYSHSMNWSTPVRMNQVFVDLWHGCGYKGQKKTVSRRVFFDYCLVPSEAFIPGKKAFFGCIGKKLLPIGYPRYDWFKTNKTSAAEFADLMVRSHGAKKLVIWMPTFRQSESKELGGQMIEEGTGLPIVGDVEGMKKLDALCGELGIVLILKRHFMQLEYNMGDDEFQNIIPVSSAAFEGNNINLYELLANTDALISDYSSVAVDYLLLDKPLAFMLDDFDKYEYQRGWSFDDPLAYMPGHHVYNFEDLEQFLRDVAAEDDEYGERRKEVRAVLHNECENYCKRIVDHFNL